MSHFWLKNPYFWWILSFNRLTPMQSSEAMAIYGVDLQMASYQKTLAPSLASHDLHKTTHTLLQGRYYSLRIKVHQNQCQAEFYYQYGNRRRGPGCPPKKGRGSISWDSNKQRTRYRTSTIRVDLVILVTVFHRWMMLLLKKSLDMDHTTDPAPDSPQEIEFKNFENPSRDPFRQSRGGGNRVII